MLTKGTTTCAVLFAIKVAKVGVMCADEGHYDTPQLRGDDLRDAVGVMCADEGHYDNRQFRFVSSDFFFM